MIHKEQSREIHRSIRRILMAEWDPIGINELREAAGEYDSYLGDVYGLLRDGASEDDLVAYLRHIEIDRMGMVDEHGLPLLDADKRRAVAHSLLQELAHYFEASSQ